MQARIKVTGQARRQQYHKLFEFGATRALQQEKEHSTRTCRCSRCFSLGTREENTLEYLARAREQIFAC